MGKRFIGIEEEEKYGKAFSLLTSDASSGQKVVVVADGTIFRPDMKVRIKDDSASESNEIDSISGNTLTMKNNLANTYTVAANAEVRILPLRYLDVVSESIRGEQGIVYAETAGTRERLKSVPGPWTESGSIDLICEPENTGSLFKFLLGKWKIDSPTKTGGNTTLSSGIAKGVRILPVVSETGFVVGDYCKVDTGDSMECRKITAVSAGSLTVDYAVRKAHSSGAAVVECEGVFRHEFTPYQEIPSFVSEVGPDVETNSRQVSGLAISSLALEAVARELLTASIDLVGQSEKVLPGTSPTFSTLKPFVFHQGQLKRLSASGTADSGTTTTTVDAERTEVDDYWNGYYIQYITGPNAGLMRLVTDFVASTDTLTHLAFPTAVASGHQYRLLYPFANAEALRVTVENAIAEDAFVLGSRFLPAIHLSGINVSGDMDLAFQSWDEYQLFLGGTEPATELSPVALNLRFLGESTGSSTADYDKYLVEIDIPSVYYDTSEANFDRRERIVQSLGWTAIYDAVLAYLIKIIVVNKQYVL